MDAHTHTHTSVKAMGDNIGFGFASLDELATRANVTATITGFITQFNLQPLQGVLFAVVALPVLVALRRAIGVVAFLLRLASEVALGVSCAGLLLVAATVAARVVHSRGTVAVPDAVFAFLADQTVLLTLTIAMVVANTAAHLWDAKRYLRTAPLRPEASER